MCHMLQLVWDSGSRKQLVNPLYQLVQLLSNAAVTYKVSQALEAQALDAEVLVGVPADLDFNKFLLDFTYRRSYLT